MKRIKQFIVTVFLCLFALSQMLYAQTDKIGKNEWLEQMKNEELKIAAFVKEHMKPGAANEAIKQTFLLSEKHEEVKEADLPQLIENHLRNYYRREYMKLHPEVLKIYNPGRVSLDYSTQVQNVRKPAGTTPNILCDYGDFESATIFNLGSQGYTGYESPADYTGGLCNFVPPFNVAYTNVTFGTADNFLITNNNPDPYVPALSQTHNGSKHAIRINADIPCAPNRGVNMLQKSFSSPISGTAKINFSYALVMEDPKHGTANPFFVARILNSAGNEVARICNVSNTSNSFFQATTINLCGRTSAAVWKDWACDYIEFNMEAGKTYTIEFFVADCGGGAHFAYAYVDDICAEIDCCPDPPPAPENLKCSPVSNGSKLFWDPVPGAAYYIVGFIAYDPACCPGPNYPPGYAMPITTTTTSLTVPASMAHCFSWYVVAVMPDNCQSAPSDTKCSCTPLPPPPVNLDCIPVPGGSKLSWDPIPGAAYYTVGIITYDPACCQGHNYPPGYATPINTSTTNLTIPASLAHCFSWSVQVVMLDSARSDFSAIECSCTPPGAPPTNLECSDDKGGSTLSWDPYPGAVYYELLMIKGDPVCCPNSTFTSYNIWNVNSTSVNVPYAYAPCFSWRVIAVMPDSSRSDTSITKCSCSRLPSFNSLNEVQIQKNGGEETYGANMSVSVVPNPASEYIWFRVYNRDKQNGSNKLNISLYDGNGREVMKKEMDANDQLRLDIHVFPDGIYTYEIRDVNKALFKDKVIIKKH